MMNYDSFYIGGTWVSPEGTGEYVIASPSTLKPVGRVPAGSPADVARAVSAARAAFAAWSATSGPERGAILARAAELLEGRREDIAQLITSEVGMPIKMSRAIQAGLPIEAWKRYAGRAKTHDFETRLANSRILEVPVGVVACITPWNYPLHQVTAKVAAALAAGCTVVLKPSEVAPLSAFLLTEVLDQAGLPAGVFNLVVGDGESVGEALVTNPDVDMISFTGSTAVGKRIARLAAENLARVSLELGGKSAAVILEDGDLERAVKNTVNACFLNGGQTCSALTRLLVPECRHEEAKEIAAKAASRFVPGNPLDDQTRLGPLVSERQKNRVLDYIGKGIDSGAELVAGGLEPVERPGHFVRATVFGGVDPASAIAQEEIFGPVLSIIRYRDEDEALAIANGTRYGLAGAVWSRDEARAQDFAAQMETGQIDINGAPFNLDAPFGGFGHSGYGRENGPFGLSEFLEDRAIQLPQDA
ncbi:aldehyde dehydrogenase family protein [Martelella sp. AMO21009]